MSSATLSNLGVYLATFVLPPVADAVYQAISAQMAGGKPIDWAQIGLVALLAALAAYVTATRPKVGHEALAAESDTLKAQGIPHHRQVVVSDTEAAIALAHADEQAP